jgi:uncharacterized radical SAM superfamily protein
MHQQFHHVDGVRRLYRLDRQMLLVRLQRLECDKENLNLVHQLLVNLDENQLLVNLLLVGLVVDVQQNRDALNLDVVLTLVDVRLDEVDVVQVDVALHLHRIQMDYFQRVVVVALLKELKLRAQLELQA